MLLMTYVKWSLSWVSGLNEQILFILHFLFVSFIVRNYDVNDNHDDYDVNCSRCSPAFKDECPNDGGICRKGRISETGDSARTQLL